MIRMPRLEALMAVPSLDAVDEVALQRLVDGAVREDVDLEFKQALYGSSDGEKKELAKDVAALANSRGGLLVIGVRDDNDVAAELTPVATGEELRLQQTIASLVAPPPQMEMRTAPAAVAGAGYYLIAVPPSPAAPHAVRIGNDSLRYPRRDGTHTRHLTESEVADAYRSRFTAAAHQVDRLDVVEAEGRDEIVAADGWLVVALVPNVGGDTSWGVAAHNEVRAWVDEQHTWMPDYAQLRAVRGADVGVSTRRFLTRFRDAHPADYLHVQLHRDGSGFVAANLWPPHPPLAVPDQTLAIEIITTIAYLAAFAQDVAHVWGDAIASVQIVPDTGALALATHPDLGYPTKLDAVGQPHGRHMLSIADAAAPSPGMLAAAKPFLDDIWAAFGVPESPHVTADGTLILHAFNSTWRSALTHLANTED